MTVDIDGKTSRRPLIVNQFFMSFFTIVFLPGLNFDSGPEVCEDSFFETETEDETRHGHNLEVEARVETFP